MSETRHHLRSVSDLYAADEIEVLLLEEIRDLEPPPSAYSKPEDIQDFEIAGSRTGGRISSQSSELDSPGIHSTVHSWDSHANYRGHYGPNDHRHGSSTNALPWPRSSHLVLYCDIQGHLKTTTGVVRLLLFISSAACLATLCSSGTAKVSLFMLPLVGRLRFMIFVAVFCLLVTALLLFLDISHVVYVFPLNWSKLNAWVFVGIGISYAVSSALLVCSVFEYHGSGWVPRRTRSQLSAAAALGLSCALLAFLLSWLHGRKGCNCKSSASHDSPNQLYKPVDNSTSSGVTLKERSPKRPPSWVVKNQSKKRQADSESNNGHRGSNSRNCDKFKRENRKDHWASAREHFLHTHDDDEVDNAQERELERKRRRRRKDGGSNGTHATSSKSGSIHGTVDENKGRKVPRKLPLQTLDRPHQTRTGAGAGAGAGSSDHRKNSQVSKQSSMNKSMQMTTNELQNYWSEAKQKEINENGLHWEMEDILRANDNMGKSIDINMVQTAIWSGQWRPPPPDDVQPCSSKTIDPYTFA